MSFWQENKIPLAIIFSGLIIGLSLYFALKSKGDSFLKGNQNMQKTEVVATPTKEVSAATAESILTEKPASTLSALVLNENQIKQGLLSKTIIPEDKLEFEISEKIDRENKILIRGTIRNKDEGGGAGFFAYCDLLKCEATFVGQGVPKCSQVNPYGYPLSWADYCLNENDDVVKR